MYATQDLQLFCGEAKHGCWFKPSPACQIPRQLEAAVRPPFQTRKRESHGTQVVCE